MRLREKRIGEVVRFVFAGYELQYVYSCSKIHLPWAGQEIVLSLNAPLLFIVLLSLNVMSSTNETCCTTVHTTTTPQHQKQYHFMFTAQGTNDDPAGLLASSE
jgi:hypothetical protein